MQDAAATASSAPDDEGATAFVNASVRRLDTGDATLAFRIFGSGPVLLMVHGFPLHGFTWRKVIPALSAGYACIAVDQAGCGDSQWNAHTDFRFPAHAQRLKQLVDHLGDLQYCILAHDTGATVGRCLGLIDAARLARMVLINTEIPGHRPPWIPLYQHLMALPGATWLFRQLLKSRLYIRSGMGFGACFADLSLLDGRFHEAFIAPCIASSRTTQGVLLYLRGIGWDIVDGLAERHRELTMPVRLLWGEDDPTFPIERAKEMALQFRTSGGLLAIPRTKLLPHEERADVVAEAVIDFLAPTFDSGE
jgi:pimeloyl-ACP methyl ester carboxylesterase